MNKPIFIVGPHKSGTTLLSRLFDGHPDIFYIPIETHFLKLSDHWITYRPYHTIPKGLNFEQIKENFIQNFYYGKNENLYYDSSSKTLSFGKNLEIDRDKFLELFDVEYSNVEDLLHGYFSAIYGSIYGTPLPENKRIVEKSVEHDEAVPLLKKYFPDAKFIRIIRNPYSNIVSLRKHYIREMKYSKRRKGLLQKLLLGWYGAYPILSKLILALENSYYSLYRNQALFPNDYKVIKYEDLVSKPKEILNELCNFLEIEYQDSMMTPTILGKVWRGNSTRNIKFQGISSVNLGKWKEEINRLERFYVTHAFPHVLRDFGYEALEKPGWSRFLPVWKEWGLTYVLNRTLEFTNFR